MNYPAIAADRGSRCADANDLVLSIGTSDFSNDLLHYLWSKASVESLFILTEDGDIADSAFMDHLSVPARRSQSWNVAPESQATLRIDLVTPLQSESAQAPYRAVMLHCSDDHHHLTLSLRSSGARRYFSPADIATIQGAARLLICLVLKHMDLVTRQERLARAISSLQDIDHHIASAPEQLSPREAQVCARILYGQTTTGIALELDIGTESVMTYRKRAYRRLGIACYRELLCWYLTLRAHETVMAYRLPSAPASNDRITG
ncbi:helix-turn-helix transcriptional regulator [Sphingobium sp.]|uniref:helix-turn-helix transcriptional regulator n=1 Tax=Sphingobium sp. TaxID=1912891 RepID=UPI003B3BA605